MVAYMRLAVVSHKPCWPAPDSPSGYATDGGFPFQMAALSELFDQTILVVPVHRKPAPSGTSPLQGHHLSVLALGHPAGSRLRRKLSLLLWMPRNMPRIWRAVHEADAVHTPLGGDVGTLGALAALVQGKPLFIRYCGLWGHPTTSFQRFWFWLCETVAGGRNVVLATGWDERPPSAKNPHIQWIFSTSLRRQDIVSLPRRTAWEAGQPLKLITVGRQEPGKNTTLTIQALRLIREQYPQTTLDIVGDGSDLPGLRKLVAELDLGDAVTFHGYVNHDAVIAALLAANIFCFPTRTEGFPKVVHEALACGLPVVTTPVSVLKHLINDQNGVLLSDTEPKTIAQAVLGLIADPDRFGLMIRHAQQMALDYSLERWRDEIGDMLRTAWNCPLSTVL